MHNTLSKATDIRRPHQRIHGCRSTLAQTLGTRAAHREQLLFLLACQTSTSVELEVDDVPVLYYVVSPLLFVFASGLQQGQCEVTMVTLYIFTLNIFRHTKINKKVLYYCEHWTAINFLIIVDRYYIKILF